MHSYQGTAGRNVQSSRELQEILANVIPAPYKDGNGERQSDPLTAFRSRLALIQDPGPLFKWRKSFWPHLMGQTIDLNRHL